MDEEPSKQRKSCDIEKALHDSATWNVESCHSCAKKSHSKARHKVHGSLRFARNKIRLNTGAVGTKSVARGRRRAGPTPPVRPSPRLPRLHHSDRRRIPATAAATGNYSITMCPQEVAQRVIYKECRMQNSLWSRTGRAPGRGRRRGGGGHSKNSSSPSRLWGW